MMNKIAFFLLVFLFTTALGLYVGYNMIPQVGGVSPITGGSIDDPYASLILLVWVLAATALLLIILKFYKGMLLFRIFEVLMIFVGSQIVYAFLFADGINLLVTIFTLTPLPTLQVTYETLVLVAAILTVVVRFVKREYFVMNLTLAITVAGVGGILGAYLGFIPALILVLGLGTYDIISVFVTKHMVKLADQSRLRELPVMFETPSEGIKTGPRPVKGKARKPDVLGLGTGDIAIPIVFFVSLVRQFTFVQVLGAVMGGIVGLGLTIYYVTQVRRAALPALPPIIGFSIIGLGLSFLLPF